MEAEDEVATGCHGVFLPRGEVEVQPPTSRLTVLQCHQVPPDAGHSAPGPGEASVRVVDDNLEPNTKLGLRHLLPLLAGDLAAVVALL